MVCSDYSVIQLRFFIPFFSERRNIIEFKYSCYISCLPSVSPYPGIYCVLLSLLVLVTIHRCIAQKPDLIIRYGKSFPSRPRQVPRSPFYAKRNEVFLPGNSDFPSDFTREVQLDTDKAAIGDAAFVERSLDFDPFSRWQSQKQRMLREKFLQD